MTKDLFKISGNKMLGYRGFYCICCNPYLRDKKPLRRIARRRLKFDLIREMQERRRDGLL